MGFPTTIAKIESAERDLGARLPDPLRRRLIRDNGGEVEVVGDTWQIHPVWDDTTPKTASRTSNHVVRETREARSWPSFPPDGVAIASNGSGDLLIVRRGSDLVQSWDHETGELRPVDVVWEP